MSSRSVHSRRSEQIQRSAIAFIRGACGAVRTMWMQIEVNAASKAAVRAGCVLFGVLIVFAPTGSGPLFVIELGLARSWGEEDSLAE